MNAIIEPPAFAFEWCYRLGASPRSLEPLKGGINNRVFRCRVGRRWFVLKGYAAGSEAGHDRFKAEVEFLNYAQLVAADFVPRLLYSDDVSRSVVLENLEGEIFRDGEHPREEDISQAIALILRLNADLLFAREYVSQTAAEGFLRLTEHLQNIDQRLKKMTSEHLPMDVRGDAERFIELGSIEFERLQECTEQLIAQGYMEDALDSKERCISPSDFGFHNAIRILGKVQFFDFEFSGWDDPTKLVVDFDLQPRIPIKSRRKALCAALPEWSEVLLARHRALFPILRLKWACIIMSPLNPDRWTPMVKPESDSGLHELLQAKLHLAQTYLTKD